MIEYVSSTWPSKLTEFLIHPQPETRSLRWNLSTASGADGWGKTGFPITHHRKRAAYKKESIKKERKKMKNREMHESRKSRLSVSESHRQLRAVHHAVHSDRDLCHVSYRSISWLKIWPINSLWVQAAGGEKCRHSSASSSAPAGCSYQVEAFPRNTESGRETM